MEKISGLEFVPAKWIEKLLLSSRILNAVTIEVLYRALYYHMTRSGK
jgi:hypothetical protein